MQPLRAKVNLEGLVWFGFFVWRHIKLCRLFNAKEILLEEQPWYYLTHSWKNKGFHTFPKDIYPKVNVITWLEYELVYYDSAVHRFNHYTTRTPHWTWKRWQWRGTTYSPKFQYYRNLTIRLFRVISRTLVGICGGSYSSAEKQSVYSTALDDRAMIPNRVQIICVKNVRYYITAQTNNNFCYSQIKNVRFLRKWLQ